MVGVLLLASGLVHLAILVMTGGTWIGPLSLRKPTTFGLSFGVTLITIAWVSSFLRLGDRARAILLGVFTIACVIETALVSLQAWRGVPSHFNTETTFDALVARTGLAAAETRAARRKPAERWYGWRRTARAGHDVRTGIPPRSVH